MTTTTWTPRPRARYRVPYTGQRITVDAALDRLALDRLNTLPPLVVVSTCAGHPHGASVLVGFLTRTEAEPLARAVDGEEIAGALHEWPPPLRHWLMRSGAVGVFGVRLTPRGTGDGAAWFPRAVERLEIGLRGEPLRSAQAVARDRRWWMAQRARDEPTSGATRHQRNRRRPMARGDPRQIELALST